METHKPPHRFREDQFRRYENILERVKLRYPTPVKFEPLNFSAETVACRIRDCVKALLRNPTWNSPLEAWCREFWHTRQVRHDGKTVWIEKPIPRGEPIVDAQFDEDKKFSGAVRLVVDKPTTRVLEALCVLIVARVVTEPVLINNATNELMVELDLHKYSTDLMFMPVEDKPNSYLLL